MSAAAYLSQPFVDENFNFRGKVLSGQEEQKPRWKRGISVVNSFLSDEIGQIYIKKHFPASSKSMVESMCQDLKSAFGERIKKLSWMTDATKAHATKKLESFTIEVGYPSFFRDYSNLTIDDDLFGNTERAIQSEWLFWKSKYGTPVDRRIWAMPPQTVNAYNMPTFNTVVFPAAILQAPFFNPKADPAVNYGAIGAVIGHEMTHGFDDQGRMFNERGQLFDWWTEKDVEEFNKRAKKYGDQFANFHEEIPKNHSINPELTMGEIIADLGGLTLALDAYHSSLVNRSGDPISNIIASAVETVKSGTRSSFEGARRVFLGFSQVWRSKETEEALLMSLASDPHPPGNARTIVPMSNLKAWYDAFNVKSGEKFHLDENDRVEIW
jgi:putative endopeptidase